MSSKHFSSEAVWSANADKSSYPQLTEDLQVDVVIVGAGITGITAAYHAIQEGQRVAVLESHRVGMGTTGSSTGNLYASIGEHLFSIGLKHNESTLKEVVKSRLSAIRFIERRIRQFNINCDFQRVPFYLFTSSETKQKSTKIRKEYEVAVKAGLNVSDVTPVGFPFQVDEILEIADQAQFNPLQYVQQFAGAIENEKCKIFENTSVTRVKDGKPCIIETKRATIKANKVIMATHSPKGVYGVHTAMEPKREHALAVKLKGELPSPGIYWHVLNDQHYSIRPYRNGENDYLLVLGESYKVGHKNHTEESFKKIEEYLRRHFEVASIEYKWAAQNYKPADTLPYIGKSPMDENVFIATGFAADGLVYGTLAAKIICDIILGVRNEWTKIYSPTRFTPVASAKEFLKASADVSFQLMKDYLFYSDADELKEIKAEEGKTIKLNGERLAVYRDPQNKLHIVSGICPHMGCVVHWNHGEKSWDCPCHGSRFSVDGEVLEGPSYKGLSQPKNEIDTETKQR